MEGGCRIKFGLSDLLAQEDRGLAFTCFPNCPRRLLGGDGVEGCKGAFVFLEKMGVGWRPWDPAVGVGRPEELGEPLHPSTQLVWIVGQVHVLSVVSGGHLGALIRHRCSPWMVRLR